jgi:hypothetical protein
MGRDVGNNGLGPRIAYPTIFLENLRKTRNMLGITVLWVKN